MSLGNITRKSFIIGISSLLISFFFLQQISADNLSVSGQVPPSDAYQKEIMDDSTVSTSQSSQIVGKEIVVTVMIRDNNGPLEGHSVVIGATGLSGISIIQESTQTDANGVITALVTSGNIGSFQLYAVDTTYEKIFNVQILLAEHPAITFLPATSVIFSPTPVVSITPTQVIQTPIVMPTPVPSTPRTPFWIQMLEHNVCVNPGDLDVAFYLIPLLLFPLLWKIASNTLEAKEASFLYLLIVMGLYSLLKIFCWPVFISYLITLAVTLTTIKILHQPIKSIVKKTGLVKSTTVK